MSDKSDDKLLEMAFKIAMDNPKSSLNCPICVGSILAGGDICAHHSEREFKKELERVKDKSSSPDYRQEDFDEAERRAEFEEGQRQQKIAEAFFPILQK